MLELTYVAVEARAYPNKADAWDAANAYVAANPWHSAAVESHPVGPALCVLIWRESVGWKGWIKKET